MMYACTIEAGRVRSLVDCNRLFYTGFAWLIYLLSRAVGLPLRAIYVLQGLSIFSSIGVLFLCHRWLKKSADGLSAALMLAFLGTSPCWWSFSSNPHSHMVSLLPLLAAVMCWSEWLETGHVKHLVSAGVCWYAAIVFHESHVIMSLVFLIAAPEKRKAVQFIAAVGMMVFMSYCVGFWISGAPAELPALMRFFLGKGGQHESYAFHPSAFFQTLFWALFDRRFWVALPFGGFLLLACRPVLTPRSRFVFIWAAIYATFFFIFQPDNRYFYVFLVLPLMLAVAGPIRGRWEWLGAALLLAAVVIRFPAELVRERDASKPENNPLLVRAKEFSSNSNPGDIFVLTSSADSSFKFALTYFGLRASVPVDLILETQHERGMSVIPAMLESQIKSGSDIYFLSEAMDPKNMPTPYQAAWRSYLENWSFSATNMAGVYRGSFKPSAPPIAS